MSKLGVQYIVKLCAMLVQSGSGIVITALTTQVLGPAQFGSFMFVRKFFEEVFALLGFGTESAYYTRLSQNPDDRTLLQFFGGYMAAMFLCAVIGVCIVWSGGWSAVVWPGQAVTIVFAGLMFAFLQRLQKAMIRTTDALHLTVRAETFRVLHRIVFLILFALIAVSDLLTLERVFFVHYMAFASFIVALTFFIARNDFGQQGGGKSWLMIARQHGRDFFQYCYPLVQYNALSFVAVAGSYWMLQYYGGSVEQGYFGLAFQISTSCLIIAQPMTQLLGREFAAASKPMDAQVIASLVKTHVPRCFLLVAAIAFFVVAYAEEAVLLIAGKAFLPAVPVVRVMALFAIYQTVTHQFAMLYYAMDLTKEYRNVGLWRQVIFMAIVATVISPYVLPELKLGAYGFALAHVGIAVVIAFVMLINLHAVVSLPVKALLLNQLSSCAICGGVVFVVKTLIDSITWDSNAWLRVLSGGIIYCMILAVITYYCSRLLGVSISRGALRSAVARLISI